MGTCPPRIVCRFIPLVGTGIPGLATRVFFRQRPLHVEVLPRPVTGSISLPPVWSTCTAVVWPEQGTG